MSWRDRHGSLDIATLRDGYASGGLTPSDVIESVLQRIAASDNPSVWITRVDAEALRTLAGSQTAALRRDPGVLARQPLFGIPFAVKDNIDVAGLPTTAACPDYRYEAQRDATVVKKLLHAGGILVGKTNLDQFATGLVGTRSPYGIPRNPFNAEFVPGGSSSGSAVAVAQGLVSFALGTDTAGSGRVPAGLNNIVGLKPTRGVMSNAGVVPACASLDCVSVFALTVDDALRAADSMAGFDPADPYSRDNANAQRYALHAAPQRARIAIPALEHMQFFGDTASEHAFDAAVQTLRDWGMEIVTLDFSPLLQAAALLYQGPWVAERVLVAQHLLQTHPQAIDPDVRGAMLQAEQYAATDVFAALHTLKALRRRVQLALANVDALLVPTFGRAYRIAEVHATPAQTNANLGYYTNFVNLLDLAAIAVPNGFLPNGMPCGVTFIGPALSDNRLAALAERMHRARATAMGATARALPPPRALTDDPLSDDIHVCVVGAHMSGLPLNYQLRDAGARLVQQTTTAPAYRLYALEHMQPIRPGMTRVGPGDGAELIVEVWAVPRAQFGPFVAGIPAPLAIGQVELADGSWVCGFVSQDYALREARDISAFGGWRAYLAAQEEK